MGGEVSDRGAIVRQLWDRLSIIDVTARVAHAQDDLDFGAYVACFTDKVVLSAAVIIPDWNGGEIEAGDLALRSFDRLSRLDACHHLVTNHVVEVSGDDATCVADLTAVSVVLDGGLTRAMTTGARYFLRFRREGQRWLICDRAVTARYQFGDPLVSKISSNRDPVRPVTMPGCDGEAADA
jgi:hypothetical protein